MTGPHLTPEREAEIRERIGVGDVTAEDAQALATALDAERRAHDQTRTALTKSTAYLGDAAIFVRRRDPERSAIYDAQVQANQVVLGLARPATEDT